MARQRKTPKQARKAKQQKKLSNPKDSNLLIRNHPKELLPGPRKRGRNKGQLAFRNHVTSGQATIVKTDLDLDQYRHREYNLKKEPKPSNDASVLKSVKPTTRWTHFVDKHGIHFASVVLPPEADEFHQSLNTVRSMMRQLPRKAGAPTEEIRGGHFHTWHLMMSGQDQAHMDGPYWNAKFMQNPQMQDFLDTEALKNIQAYCNRQFYECFPDHASFYQYVGDSSEFKPYGAFKYGPCFPSLALNEEVSAISAPHRDRRDYLQGLAGVMSIGSYKHTTLNMQEANISVEFPAGALAFFPSHVVHHYNTNVAEGETRGSMTMFMSSDVVKWAGLGGKAGSKTKEEKEAYKRLCIDNWNLFKHIKDKIS